MSSAGKVFTLVLSVGVLAVHPCGAEVVRADRVELQLPEGGMTLLRPPRSTSTFKHRLFDITIDGCFGRGPRHERPSHCARTAGRYRAYRSAGLHLRLRARSSSA